jgi:hypothetical protein
MNESVHETVDESDEKIRIIIQTIPMSRLIAVFKSSKGE